MKKRISLFLFFLLVYTSPGFAAESKMVFLGNIEFSFIKENSQKDFEVRLYVREKAGLLKYLAEERSYNIIEKSDYLSIKNRHYSFPKEKDYKNIEPSFINDFNVELFTPIREEIMKQYGKTPEPEELTQYVNKYITNKSFSRGFDTASVVAEKREGDCTEHAILLVSIMRMFKIPARLVMGVKFFEEEEASFAYGHAWVEYVHKGKWKGADPSLLNEVDHSYIPTGTVDREGMGYTMGMIPLFNRLPYRIERSGL